MIHQPSFAAQVAARESALGRTLSSAERSTLKNNTPAVRIAAANTSTDEPYLWWQKYSG